MWNNLGNAPAPTVKEVTVIGPGQGESVVVHLGNGEWLVVDSCASSSSRVSSAPLQYLTSIGVDVSNDVKLIVVSHWDDDHIRGISNLLDACRSAVFCCSTSFTEREFIKFVEAMSLGGKTTGNGNVSEFNKCLRILADRKQIIRRAFPGRQLSDKGQPTIKSWSPSDFDDACFLEYVASYYPADWAAMRRAIPGSPNLTSVVISIDWEDVSILLGADMETSTDIRRGWGAIAAEANRVGFEKGGLVKIPHHGSEGAHDERMWSQLLHDLPISIVAPFGKGAIKSRPPQPSDIKRIVDLSSQTYLTANKKPLLPKKKSAAVARSLREGGIRLSAGNSAIGMVRMRKAQGSDWTTDLFGAAVRAK
ncbi:MAG: MBL fold metallo-hydrolase [Georgfuchsia sp.]